jgi:hypothetical protein
MSQIECQKVAVGGFAGYQPLSGRETHFSYPS